ncbi:DUF294 nucleotidyltransferase-like domain-containing protein [Aestuariibacter salexigens]|uniref:DUF294 nucleotidyltransferase-like domain-containing protein n=1 Tax=Aestuariibacter salexigens TaxID=226010 RepID=UPI0004026BB2|nr:DUF294 nucleotidyltransferase-like domain-containing protein [Aestuariibacter salexigens]
MNAVAPQQALEFLRSSAPFDGVDEKHRISAAQHTRVIYLTEENKQELLAEQQGRLFLIHSGQYSVKDSDGAQRHVSEGDYFGFSGLLDRIDYPIELSVDSPGLVYCIDGETFTTLIKHSASFSQFFKGAREEELQNQAVSDSNSMWLYKPLAEVISGDAVSAEHNVTIQQAASVMSERGVSSLLITEKGELVGIVTDRDLRNRVVALGADMGKPVSTIMTRDPARIRHNRTMFNALSIMSERNIHHLPVIDEMSRRPLGMITASDIVRHQKSNVLFIIGELSKAQNLYELTRCSWQMPHYLATHAKRLGDFDIAGKVLSQATDIMTRRLITFFQQQHGSAPMSYCWIVYGSQAREDQTMGSDQDNALLLADKPDEQQAEYFRQMSEYVCQGLGKCGIKLCDGNIMASNPDLRLSIDDAIAEAKRWVRQPTKEAIMHFNIFLDARAVAGDMSLFNRMQSARAPLLKQNMFLAALARHANEASVPLSMFQKFVYAKGRDVQDSIDIKKQAVAIINNLVRLYALANELKMPATLARLANLPENAGLSPRDADNLRDIWLFLNRLRWRHQLQNSVTDNYVRVSDLSSIEKHQLKAAFKAIERAQQAAVMKFSGGVN